MIFWVLLTLLLAVILGGGYYAYRVAFYNPPSDPEQSPNLDGSVYETYREELGLKYNKLRDRECEFVTITSDDGLTLFGRYYHVRDGAPLDIGFHGYRSRAFTDFAGGSEISFDLGHNLLLVDQRAHGRSDGRTITFGIQERWDVLAWVRYALDRFGKDTNILLYGVSMGAATVLMASGLELPANVKGIIADSPYASPMEIILHVGKGYPIPQWLIKPFVIIGAKVYGGFDIQETDAVEAVANAKVPILVIHGEADDFVPAAMSETACNANPGLVTRLTFPGAAHVLSFMTDPDRYQKEVRDFIQKVMEE